MSQAKYSCPCPTCGKLKYYASKVTKTNRKANCKECSAEARRVHLDGKRLYDRVCKTCGDIAKVTYKPTEDVECRKCSRLRVAPKLAKKRYRDYKHIRYWYFCPYCSSVKAVIGKRKTPLCGSCSRKRSKTKPIKGYYDLGAMEMRYFRICPHCPEDDNTMEVHQASLAGIRPCRKHKYVGKEAELARREEKRLNSLKKTCAAKPKKKKSRATMSKVEIERRRAINKAHRESEKARREKEKLRLARTKTDEEMMEEWLANNKVKVLEDNKISGVLDE